MTDVKYNYILLIGTTERGTRRINLLHLELGEKVKKLPVLTETHWKMIHMIELAIEVFIGKRVKFLRLDLNTGSAQIEAGVDRFEVEYFFNESSRLFFHFKGKWCCALFDTSGQVRVGHENPTIDDCRHTVAGDFSMGWVGSSFTNRYEEPLFLEEAKYCAKVHGLTLEQLLVGEKGKQQPVKA